MCETRPANLTILKTLEETETTRRFLANQQLDLQGLIQRRGRPENLEGGRVSISNTRSFKRKGIWQKFGAAPPSPPTKLDFLRIFPFSNGSAVQIF